MHRHRTYADEQIVDSTKSPPERQLAAILKQAKQFRVNLGNTRWHDT